MRSLVLALLIALGLVCVPRAADAADSSAILASIERFGFASRPKLGVGGFITVDVYPVVLFRNGDALTDVQALSFPLGLEAHKRAHPQHWTRWRRANGEWQLAHQNGWKALPFRETYATLPNDFRLDGLFRSLAGVGATASGGGQEVTSWSTYQFHADGKVVRGGGAGARNSDTLATVTTQSVSPSRRGRYRIDGLTLTITYDDGSSERHVLITHPKNPESSIWLDGIGYARRKS